ncbi:MULTISPECIES: polysaccharide deacetylase family protein [unclassified Bradyrhizobium]|jgi:peptidoglycan/xylan/chitin deacetylase (PgdA/CDA1 family)|uniref:polysaccharide deacetylase family protein n=1 Tax=unclassified Bradyrhizobium TaxID=2631580 RepID=UPI001FF812BE|nr:MULTISPECIES: polysaccharide deacetylase family protein [unclassified Bradyrhizobium]MCK1518903.1 polysaccharide deacetylase family protein [Bradyrhizobium sp. 17]MCK1689703.1 polysaccharide deacetylase family protein [Bradyrhizobium sp. 145]
MKVIEFRRYVKIGISLAYYALRGIFCCSFRLVGRPCPRRLTILYYHAVSSEDRIRFVRQMGALHRRAHVLPASYRGELPSGKKCVAITFDDALVSVAANALPELAIRSFHSTIFVPVDWIGRVPGWAMKKSEHAAAAEQAEAVMSSDQLRALDSSLVSLGSHSLTHRSMVEVSITHAQKEIEHSRHRLAELSGREVLEFSFPYGEYDEAAVAICRAAGYTTVYSIRAHGTDTTTAGLLRGRTKVDPSDGQIEFFLKFNGAYDWMGHNVSLRKMLRLGFGKRVQSVRIESH